MDSPFRIKICGITSESDARAAADAGADAIGLNFCPTSSRFVTDVVARQIAAAVRDIVKKVGVFVNADVDQILRIVETVGLDAIQMHGDEPPEMIHQLRPWKVIRAVRCSEDWVDRSIAYVEACRGLNCQPAAWLVDSAKGGQFGGSGRVADPFLIRRISAKCEGLPIILAGGLRPENVASMIRNIHPNGVDTASGVESAPGHKDPDSLRAFVQAAKQAFENL